MSVEFVVEVKEKLNVDMEHLQSVACQAIEAAARCDQLPLPPSVCVLFTDDAEIQTINATMRGVNHPTDVLSFPLISFKPGPKDQFQPKTRDIDVKTGELCMGDIAVSLQRVEAQSKEYGHSFDRELAYLCVHGMCHLLGYDHMNEQDKTVMRALEERALETIHMKRN